MHQYAGLGDIISMIVLNLEVIDLNRALQQFMLHLLHNDILAVDENQNIPRTKMYSICPALDRTVERVAGRTDNFLVIYKFYIMLWR
jgi:hypothetical protein